MAMSRADWNLTRKSRIFFRFTHNFLAWKAYTRASEEASAHFPAGPSQFEL
jgi:hypothetical protein